GVEFDVFQILGPEEARRASTIWSPATRLITQEISIAFNLVEKQRQAREVVNNRNITRLVETLAAYFKSVGRPKSKETMKAQIEEYLKEHGLSDADAI